MGQTIIKTHMKFTILENKFQLEWKWINPLHGVYALVLRMQIRKISSILHEIDIAIIPWISSESKVFAKLVIYLCFDDLPP